jgi:hypothetical protein
MKLCPYCSTENPDDHTYCKDCGAALKTPATCPSCGAPCPHGAEFCQKCGKALGPAPVTPPVDLRIPSELIRPLTVGTLGGALAVIGVFLPFVSILGLGGPNYLGSTSLAGDRWRGYVVLCAAALGGGGAMG